MFAVSSSLAVIGPVLFGIQLLTPLPHVLALACGALLFSANLRTVELMHDNTPKPAMPRARMVLSFALALLVGCLATLWFFNGAIEAAQASAEPAGRAADVQGREAEREAQRRIADRSLSTVDQDPEVKRLQQEHDDLKRRHIEAYSAALCELDGTCGTRQKGKADAYYERIMFRDVLAGLVAEAAAQLDSVKAERQHLIAQLAQEQQAARKRVDDITAQLEQPPPSHVESRAWISAVMDVVREHKDLAAALTFGALAAFPALDLLPLRFAVRRICRREEMALASVAESQKNQWEKDGLRARKAIPAADYMRGQNGEPEAGE